MVRRPRQAALALCLLSLFAGAAHAIPIYSNLGPGDTWIVNREYDTNVTYLATSFTATSGGALENVRIPIFSLDSPVEFGLYDDSSGHPGGLLEGWSATVPGIPGVLTTLDSALHPVLQTNQLYWFVLTQTKAEQAAWYENNQGVGGGAWAGSNLNNLLQFVPDSPAPAIELNPADVAAVPEPSGAGLLGGGILLLAAGLARRGRFA